jgi:hypothetical protein
MHKQECDSLDVWMGLEMVMVSFKMRHEHYRILE